MNRQWKTVAVARLDAKGKLSFVLSTRTKGIFGYKVYRPRDATNLAGGSPSSTCA